MVKAQKISGRKAQTLGVILSIGLFGVVAEAGKNPPPATTPAPAYRNDEQVDAGWAEEIRTDTVANVKAREVLPTLDPGSPQARQIQRDIAQRDAKAESYAQRAPTNVPVLTAAADQALGNGDIARAQGRADQAVSAAAAETDSKKYAEKWPAAMNMRAKVAKAAEDYPAANAYAAEVLKKFPKDPTALGLFHETKGRTKPGTAPAPTVAQSHPAPPTAVPSPYRDPQVQLAGERARERHQAIDFYNKAKSSNNLNDTARALEYAQAAIRADPSLPDSYMERAKALLGMRGGDRRDQLAQAINDLRSAMELWMKNGQTGRLAEANGLSAKAKNANGDYNGAQDDANRAMSYNAGYAPAYWERGVAREALKQKELALADYNKSAALLPEVYGAANDAATVRLMAPESAGPVPVARPAESALHKAWTKLEGKAGGSFALVMGTMGALLVLFAGCVLWFAKEGSPASRVRSFFTRRSQVVSVTTPAPAEEPREIGGHIELRREIDRGGMGVIYEAFDKNLKRPVAVKRLLPELQSEDLLKRILAEAQTLALFHHPHIVEIYEVITEGEDIFLVQPLLDGHTVYVELNESSGRRLTTERTFEIALAVASAIDYSHAKGVIHRDLKPSNIMVTKDGRILVMDYGIAKSNVNHSQITKTGMSVGTPAYMAPEQEMGKVCRQSDVFALAASLYEMLSGRLPFGMNDLFRKLQKEPGRFVTPSSLILGLPPAVDAVFEKGLAGEPGDRQKTCTELVQDLKAAFLQPTPPRA